MMGQVIYLENYIESAPLSDAHQSSMQDEPRAMVNAVRHE